MVGLGGFEPPTSRLSGVRSNQLSYRPPESQFVYAAWRSWSRGDLKKGGKKVFFSKKRQMASVWLSKPLTTEKRKCSLPDQIWRDG